MGWARLDDGFHDHPKLIGLPLEAIGLWTKCFTWAHRHQGSSLILGHIPEGLPTLFAGARGPKLAAFLVGARLWDVELHLGGWVIHDYGDYLPATERPTTANDVRKARSEAGTRGAKARWQKEQTPKQVDSKLLSDSDGKTMPPTRPDQIATVSPSRPAPERESYPQDDDERAATTRRDTYWRGLRITNPARITALIGRVTDRPITESQALQVTGTILERSKVPPANAQAYVEAAITKSWVEIQRDLDTAAVSA